MTNPYEMAQAERLDLASQFLADPWAANQIIFKDDHSDASAPFHEEIVLAMTGPHENELFMCFRGSAKSTKAEEVIAVMATAGQINNCMIVGDSADRAAERLTTIRRHIKSNRWLRYLYGDQSGEVEGDTWQGRKIELASGTVVSSIGQGQAVLGAKHIIHRPDFILVDDLEDAESASTDASRRKLSDWFWGELLPAMAPPGQRRVRILGTPWHPKSLLMELSKLTDYNTHVIPIEYVNQQGERTASWPARWPLEKIDKEYGTFVEAHKQRVWAMQMMVAAVNPELQLFKEEHFHVEPRVRTYEPVYISYDPARSTKETSATTGIVAASYVGRKLVVWEARGPRILPSEIVDDVFRMEEKYGPVAIGIEKDGLEEFLMEPLRKAQLDRGHLLPLRPLQAPRRRGGGSKDDFITKLQPMYEHDEIIFAGQEADFKDAKSQILSFPVGDKDILNALAYLPQLRGGEPIYNDLRADNIYGGDLRTSARCTLAVNAGAYGTTAVLFEYSGGILYVHQDWISESAPGTILGTMIEEARLVTGKNSLVVVPPFHFDTRNSFGLLPALRGVAEARKGGDIIRGREFLRKLLRTEVRGSAAVLLGEGATWTRRAMSGGFVWEAGRTEPQPGLYRTLIEGLEASMGSAAYTPTEQAQPSAIAADGTRYETADPRAQGLTAFTDDGLKERVMAAQRRMFETR